MLHSNAGSLIVGRLIQDKGIYDTRELFFTGCSLEAGFMVKYFYCRKRGIISMPIYEYQAEDPEKACTRCRPGFEYLQGVNEMPLSDCPQCGGRVKKIISWCHTAVIDSSPECDRVERKVTEYEGAGMHSHAAELADKYSHQTKDKLLKERALENYKKAGYNFDSTPTNDN